MESVWFYLFSHWGVFLIGFIVGIFWATRPRDDAEPEHSSQRW